MQKTILHITSEVAPYYKRGGLGDVLGALPNYLSNDLYANVVISQYYKGRMKMPEDCKLISAEMEIYGMCYSYNRYFFKRNKVQYFFLNLEDQDVYSELESQEDGDQPYKGRSSYMYYLYFAKTIWDTLRYTKIHPSVIFCHDWQSAGIFAFKHELDHARRRSRFVTIFMIHNYNFQGDISEKSLAFLPPEISREVIPILLKHGSVSLLALAIEKSDHVATVSRTYAKELLQGMLPHKGLKYLKGHKRIIPFLNGVDYNLWHPKNSPFLVENYDRTTVFKKKSSKQEILNFCNFRKSNGENEAPLVLIMSRLTPQKGIQHLINDSSPDFTSIDKMKQLLGSGLRLIIFGTPSGGADGHIHKKLNQLHLKFTGQLYYNPNYSENLAHRFLAAADILLAPSLFEPCGLVQIYAMAFGTIPIVRPVGGLKDTVIDYKSSRLKSIGFYIDNFAFESLRDTLFLAIAIYNNNPEEWKAIMERAMNVDYSWDRMKHQYFNFFEKIELKKLEILQNRSRK